MSDARAPRDGPSDDGAPDRPDEAERAYEYFQIGRRFLAERRPAQAAMYLERAMRLVPDKNSVREALGRSYYALGRYEVAAREFGELLGRAPGQRLRPLRAGALPAEAGRRARARAARLVWRWPCRPTTTTIAGRSTTVWRPARRRPRRRARPAGPPAAPGRRDRRAPWPAGCRCASGSAGACRTGRPSLWSCAP